MSELRRPTWLSPVPVLSIKALSVRAVCAAHINCYNPDTDWIDESRRGGCALGSFYRGIQQGGREGAGCVTQARELHPTADLGSQGSKWKQQGGMRGSLSPYAEGVGFRKWTSPPQSFHIPQSEMGCRQFACGVSERKAPSRFASKTSLENIQGRICFCKRASARHG